MRESSGEKKFLALYRALNPAQRQAVDTIDGPVMVIAGPGTGKTQVLTLRIANILRQTDAPPDAILALAFTRSAVESMRTRLVEIVGTVGYRVKIHTFHGFGNEIIRTYPDYFPRLIGSTAALYVDQVRIMKAVIDSSRLEFLKPFGSPYYYLALALGAIDRLKKENVSPAELAKRLRAPPAAARRLARRHQEFLKLYRAYEARLAAERLYDFNDMVMEVIRVLERERDFRTALQIEHQYLLADEHQDANQGQNDLLRLLTNFDGRPNLFIVGDTKQAIFQFQGASLDNFNYFRKLYPSAKIIALADNYRSSQLILDAAGSLLGSSRGLDEASLAPLTARAPSRRFRQKVILRVFAAEADEFAGLAEEISTRLKKDRALAAGEIAVIFRDNRDGEPVLEALERAGVPAVVESETNVLRDMELRKLILLFRAIHNFGDDDWLKPALHLDFLALPALDLWRLIAASRQPGRAIYDLLRRPKALGALGLEEPEKFSRLYERLARWKQAAHNRNFTDLFGLVLEESGFLPRLLRHAEAAEKLAKLQSFFDELKNLLKQNPDFSLTDFLAYLDLLEEQQVAINLKDYHPRAGVRLLTAHKAKGLEFDYVYIVRAYDGHFGRRRAPALFRLPWRRDLLDDEETIEAERRLFYVALTRARRGVTVSFAETDAEGRHRLPSQFLEEIDKKFLTMETMTDVSSSVASGVEHFRPRRPIAPRLDERAFLNQLFIERGLSATALNNYLACPLKYFFNNLLRVVKVRRRELLYGTAAHETLKLFFDRYRRAGRLTGRMLIVNFRRALGRQPLSPLDRAAVLAKGERALGGYFRHYYPTWPRTIVNEFRIRGVTASPGLKLTGQIDKLEFLGPGDSAVNVVDYKTGKPKTRGEILGRTKNATGDYHRQLVFYKLLLDNYDRDKYRVVSGELDFIEPDARGEYRKERFDLAPAAVGELRALVERVAGEIRALKFFNRGCGKPNCESCVLWRMMGQRFA